MSKIITDSALFDRLSPLSHVYNRERRIVLDSSMFTLLSFRHLIQLVRITSEMSQPIYNFIRAHNSKMRYWSLDGGYSFILNAFSYFSLVLAILIRHLFLFICAKRMRKINFISCITEGCGPFFFVYLLLASLSTFYPIQILAKIKKRRTKCLTSAG